MYWLLLHPHFEVGRVTRSGNALVKPNTVSVKLVHTSDLACVSSRQMDLSARVLTALEEVGSNFAWPSICLHPDTFAICSQDLFLYLWRKLFPQAVAPLTFPDQPGSLLEHSTNTTASTGQEERLGIAHPDDKEQNQIARNPHVRLCEVNLRGQVLGLLFS